MVKAVDGYIRQMEELGSLSIAEAAKHPVLGKVRNFLKTAQNTPEIDTCRRLFNALRLGVTPQAFDATPGFEDFAARYSLHRYLLVYGHELRVQNNKILILKDDQYTEWQPLPETHGTSPKQAWVYGEHGYQDRNMYAWEKPEPFIHEKPTDRFYLEFCTCGPDDTAFSGHHSWFRIVQKDGGVISIGKYRPGKAQGVFSQVGTTLAVKPGYLMCPDVSEFWPFPIISKRYEINEGTAEKILRKVTELKRNEATEEFHNLSQNCTVFNNMIAEMAGIKLETKERLWRMLTPRFVHVVVDWLSPRIPRVVHVFFDHLSAFVVNLLAIVFFGATRVDERMKNSRPHIQSFKDIFNPEKATGNHPSTLARFLACPA